MWTGPRWWILTRDIASFMLGGGLVIHQAVQLVPSIPILGVAVALMGLPGALNLGTILGRGTAGSPSQSPPSELPKGSP